MFTRNFKTQWCLLLTSTVLQSSSTKWAGKSKEAVSRMILCCLDPSGKSWLGWKMHTFLFPLPASSGSLQFSRQPQPMPALFRTVWSCSNRDRPLPPFQGSCMVGWPFVSPHWVGPFLLSFIYFLFFGSSFKTFRDTAPVSAFSRCCREEGDACWFLAIRQA